MNHMSQTTQTEKPDAFRLGEIGFSGDSVFKGMNNSELKTELNHPNCLRVYKEMSYHPSISAPLSLYNNMVAKARFQVKPVKDANEEEKNQAERVQEMLADMDVPLADVVVDIMSMSTHGFSIVEKVYRKRYTSNGSMYNDGLVGIKKLAWRSQDTIEKFIFDDSGNEVIGVKQNLAGKLDVYNRLKNRSETSVVLPKKKYMHFTVGRNRTNPFGVSPLRDVYTPWRYLTAIEELEAAGVAKDLQGLPVES